MRRTTLFTLLVALVSFAAGFLTHRHSIEEFAETTVAFFAGESGGCGLSDMIQDPLRVWKFRRSMDISLASLKLLEEAPDGFRRWDTALGPVWSPPGNSPRFVIGEQLAEVYTEDDMALGPNDVVLDCGANIGDFVLVCLKAGVAKVVAIDPSPNNVEAMRRSFPNEIASGQVVIVPKGVWHEDSTMTMFLFENSLLDSLVMRDRHENVEGGKPREVNVPLTTIDMIVEELELDRVTFIKMDVEGAERNAIRGAAKTIARFRPRMSLATENLDDDYLVVPREVAKLGQNFEMGCGLCRKVGLFAYRPDILFFTPK